MSTVVINTPHAVSRDGLPVKGKVVVRQVLETPTRRDGTYYALIHDPGNGEVLARIPLHVAVAGETVEVSIEFEVSKVHQKV